MKGPAISVIVPVYNAEKWLRRCVDSILAQTFTDFELIIIDDGSTDGSDIICDEYAKNEPRVRVFHKTNGGASSARNIGLDNARGEWITFCDSDDYVFSDWLEIFKLDESHNYDLLTQGINVDKPSYGEAKLSDHSGFDGVGNPVEFLEKAYRHYIVGYTFIKAFRKKIIQDNGLKFDEQLWLREDDVFVLEYLAHCQKIRTKKESGYFYYTPDWGKKYKISFSDRLCLEERMFDALSKIKPSTYYTNIALENRNVINGGLTEEFHKTRNWRLVRKLHNYFKAYPDFATLSSLTRKALQLDSTCIFSGIILYLHMSLRKLFGMGGAKDRIFGQSSKH